MQKYYHKGAFFQNDDERLDDPDLKERDFNMATGEDKIDKSILPSLM